MHNHKASVLKEYFGYDDFREGQEYLIDAMLQGHDVLGVMPTGAGKSICFQVPAMLLDGITIVISPLISLMKDQVNTLTQAGIQAAYLNSSLSMTQYRSVVDNACGGAYKIIYVAPERLLAQEFLDFAQTVKIAMVSIDEAHCISQWGQDFRPSYTRIADFIEKLENRPIVSAFTATATKRVREDIVACLKLKDVKALTTGFDRKNLYFEVQQPKNKIETILAFLEDKKEKTGIIYCLTRKSVEEVCDVLNQHGFYATRYHAGLSDKERKENQDDFTFDRKPIMVATNAFGMGIDKSNVSFVVHYNMPKNMESYYQEAGRAGRDGEPAECILLYSGQDVRTNLYLIDHGNEVEFTDAQTQMLAKERERQRLKTMTYYCNTNDCLRSYILNYFGDHPDNFCGNCGSCNSNFSTVDITIDAQKILSCVVRTQERFGVKVMIDVLRGSKNEKMIRLGLNQVSTYGISKLSEKKLRAIINYLILNDFLFVTNDEFPIVKLGERANEVLKKRIPLEMKLCEESELQVSIKKKTQIQSKHTAINDKLFAHLKQLRHTIANEQKVPAFVVFSDSTLIDMCSKLPKNTEEMLDVSGVGQVKVQRYGDLFLNAISDFYDNNEVAILNTASEIIQQEIEQSDELVSVSVVTDRINCYLIQKSLPKLTAVKINNWLMEQGYLEIFTDENNKQIKVPTQQGMDNGITCEERMIRGQNCFVNQYGKQAQQIIIAYAKQIGEEFLTT